MPDGKSQFDAELRGLEDFFRPIEPVLTEFARSYNLKSRKYYHDAPSWDFVFQYPTGAIGKIEVRREGTDNVSVNSCLWLDDYETTTRFIKESEGRHFPKDSELLPELHKELLFVLAWPAKDWTSKSERNEVWKRTWTKEQFLSLANEYPIPRV